MAKRKKAAADWTAAVRKQLEALRDKPRFSCSGESHSLAVEALEALDRGDMAKALQLAMEAAKLETETAERNEFETAEYSNERFRQSRAAWDKLAAINAMVNGPGPYAAPSPAVGPALTRPLTKTELGKAFSCHRNQVDKLVLAKYRNEPDGARFRMAVEDMPAEWRAKNGLQ